MSDHQSQNSETQIASSADIAAQELVDRRAQITKFVRTNADYYITQFDRIGSEAKFGWTINLWAGLLGPIWFAARGLWNWGLSFLIIEIFAFVQIARGLFGDLASSAWDRRKRFR